MQAMRLKPFQSQKESRRLYLCSLYLSCVSWVVFIQPTLMIIFGPAFKLEPLDSQYVMKLIISFQACVRKEVFLSHDTDPIVSSHSLANDKDITVEFPD